MDKHENKLSVVDYINEKGVMVENHNKTVLAYSNEKAALYDIALQAENVSQALASLAIAEKVDESIKAFKTAFIVKELRDNPKFWEKESILTKGDFIKACIKSTGYSKEMLYKLLKTTEIASPINGRDTIRPEQDEKLTFSKLRYIADFFGNKDKSNKKDGESNIDFDRLKTALLHKVQQYNPDTGALIGEKYIISNSTSNSDIRKVLEKYGYITPKVKPAESDKNAAKTGESNAKGESTNSDKKGTESGEKAVKKPLSLQALYNAVVALCNENGKTISDIVKYHESINK